MEYEPFPEEAKTSWDKYLGRFINVIYPQVFKPYGININTAFLLFSINDLDGGIKEVQSLLRPFVEELQSNLDDGEEWKNDST